MTAQRHPGPHPRGRSEKVVSSDIPFVDAHVHLWDLAHLRYPWLSPPFSAEGPNGNVEPIASTYTLDSYQAEAAGWNVVGMVHIDAGAERSLALAETEWLQAIRDAQGMPTGIVAFAALDDPALDTVLVAQTANAAVRGIRQIINWHPDPKRTYTAQDVTSDCAWRAGYAQLGHHDLSFDLQCYPGQMATMAELVARHPGIPVIINHMGMPTVSDATGLADWRRGLRDLAAYPHVSIKISGVGFIYRQWTQQQIRPLILEVIDMFGADRCMFASDVPTDRLFGSFDRHMDAYHAIVADFTDAEKRAMFGRNANRIYRLGLAV